MRQLILKDAMILAENKGERCLSKEYFNNKTYMLWKCEIKEHLVWQAKFKDIRNGKWCPECGIISSAYKRKMRNGLEIAQELATKNNGKCISDYYTNMHNKMVWKCHVFDHPVCGRQA